MKYLIISYLILCQVICTAQTKELLLHRLKLEIMQTYIEYLDNLGLLAQQPYRNYLMKEVMTF